MLPEMQRLNEDRRYSLDARQDWMEDDLKLSGDPL
jgi:hypothetical protein